MTEYIGALAAILTTISFIPQAIKILQTRNTEGISLLMYILFTAGVAMWALYGILLSKPPIIVANGITFGIAFCILTLKIRDVMVRKL